MKSEITGGVLSIALLSVGCGASGGNPESNVAGHRHANLAGESEDGQFSDSSSADSTEAEASEEASSLSELDGGEISPQFTPGMSVVEATNAVPDSAQRLNIEQEALAAPLMDPGLYEPCALAGHHHFKVRVAVWDGRAVGLDVSTQPSDSKLESCLRQQLSNVEWKDKAKSINTVEYSY